MLYQQSNNQFASVHLPIKVVAADGEIIAEAEFDLAKNVQEVKKTTDIIISLDLLGS